MNESLGGLTLAEIGQTDALVWAVAVELDMPRIGQTLPGGGCVRTIFAMRQDNPASLARAVATVVAEPLERRLLGVRHLPLRLVVGAPHPPLRAVAEATQGAGHTFGLLLLLPGVAAGAGPIWGHVAVDVRWRLDGVDRVDVAGVELVISLGFGAALPSLNALEAGGAPLRLVQTGAFVGRLHALRVGDGDEMVAEVTVAVAFDPGACGLILIGGCDHIGLAHDQIPGKMLANTPHLLPNAETPSGHDSTTSATASHRGATRIMPAQMPRCRAVIALPLSEIDQVGVRVAGYR
jgi:hypothetical protein